MLESIDQGGADAGPTLRIRFLGHATVMIDLDGTRVLTDPVLRRRASVLVRRTPLPPDIGAHAVDAVLISHMHRDHLDVPSLRRLRAETPMLVPRRAGLFLVHRGFSEAREMRPGDAARIGALRVVATPARHAGFRPPFGPLGGCLGFVVEGSLRVYFAGDTALFPQMAHLGPLDVALLPVAGWGPALGPGHLDARGAARALRLLRPKVAIPIHWGTLAPAGMHLRPWPYLVRPPLDFLAYARELAPDVDVRLLEPGDSIHLGPSIYRAPSAEDGSRGPADSGPGPAPAASDWAES